MSTKVCAKCGEEKPTSEYGKHPRNKDGLQSYCKACSNEHTKAYYRRHSEFMRLKRNKRYTETKRSPSKQKCDCGDYVNCLVCRNRERWSAFIENRAPLYLVQKFEYVKGLT